MRKFSGLYFYLVNIMRYPIRRPSVDSLAPVMKNYCIEMEMFKY